MLKELILTVGLPSSGKTLFSRYLQGVKKNLYRVSIRDIYKMVDNKYRDENVPKYLAIQEHLILRMLEFGSVIVDNMHLTTAERSSIIRPVRLVYPHVNVSVYQMSRTFQNCKDDNLKRAIVDENGFFLRVPEETMNELNKSYQVPQLSEDIQSIMGVKWSPSEHFKIGNIHVDHKPKIFEIASRTILHVVDKPKIGPEITMSGDD